MGPWAHGVVAAGHDERQGLDQSYSVKPSACIRRHLVLRLFKGVVIHLSEHEGLFHDDPAVMFD